MLLCFRFPAPHTRNKARHVSLSLYFCQTVLHLSVPPFLPPSLSRFIVLSTNCPSGLPPQSDTSVECVSIHQSCLTLATGTQPGSITKAASCQRISSLFLPPTPPPPRHRKHTRRQGAGLVDEKKFTNCLIIQISMIMNRYSTVREHGVQPELPPQHSSCES